MSVAFHNRAIAYSRKNEHAAAVKDYTEAIPAAAGFRRPVQRTWNHVE